jgi:hypothetical protein
VIKKANNTADNKLKKQAEENTTVVKKKAREPEEVVKEGKPLDHSIKQTQREAVLDSTNFSPIVGLSKGVTKNMGDYQSFRVDCWLVDQVREFESEQVALERLSEIIDDRINTELDRIGD